MNLLTTLFQNALFQTLGWALVHFLWQGLAMAMLLAGALTLLRTKSANARYLAACTALALMACLPVLTVYLLQARPQISQASTASVELSAPSNRPEPARNRHQLLIADPSVTESLSPTRGLETASERAALTRLDRYLPWLVAVWLLGVGVLSLRLLGGWLITHRLIRSGSIPENPGVIERVDALAQRMQVHRRIRVLVSPHISVPSVIGCLRSVILIPSGALIGLAPNQLEALLAHELAHVRRYDYLVNLLQTAVETLLFYHPAVWWVSGRIQVERENCCDDLAIEALGDRLVYARALTSMEELRMANSVLPSHAMAANSAPLAARIRRILGLPARHIAPGWTAGTLLLAISLTAVVAVAIKAAPGGTSADQKSADKTKQAVTSKLPDSDDSIKIDVKAVTDAKAAVQTIKPANRALIRSPRFATLALASLQGSQEDQQKLAELKAKEAALTQKEQAESAEIRAREESLILKERAKPDELKVKGSKEDQQKLAELRARDQDILLKERAALDGLKAKSGARSQKREQADQSVNQAKAMWDQAQAQMQRAKALYDSGAMSQQEMDAARANLAAAEATLVSAQRQSELARTGRQGMSSDEVTTLKMLSEQMRRQEMDLTKQLAVLKAQQEAIRKENAQLKAQLRDYMRIREQKGGKGTGADKRSRELLQNYSMSPDTESLLRRRERLLRQLDEARIKTSDDNPLMLRLKKQIDELTEQIPNTPQTAKASAEGAFLRREKLQGDLDEARLYFKEQHPRIQNLKKQIDELTAQLPKTPQSADALSNTSRSRQGQKASLMDELKKEEDRLQQLQLEYKDSHPKVVSEKKRIEALQKQLDELKVRQTAKP
jgi:beta-lactamase regulating signal transducer with metallopeptidase domain